MLCVIVLPNSDLICPMRMYPRCLQLMKGWSQVAGVRKVWAALWHYTHSSLAVADPASEADILQPFTFHYQRLLPLQQQLTAGFPTVQASVNPNKSFLFDEVLILT